MARELVVPWSRAIAYFAIRFLLSA
jgi:hypothetical protein